MSHQRKLRYYIDLVLFKAKADLRAEAARGYLGVLWWILEPILYMSVFYFVFGHFFQRGDDNYIVVLFSGLITWKWFHSTLIVGSNSLMGNAHLMNQVYLPKVVFPVTTVLVNTTKFLIIMALFLILLHFGFGMTYWTWLFLPGIIIVQLLLILATATLLSAIMPFFPDFMVILENILMMLLFLSGIFFDIAKLPAQVQSYLMLNPMAFLITAYRDVLLFGTSPNWEGLLIVILFSLLLLILSGWLLQRFDRVYPKIIY